MENQSEFILTATTANSWIYPTVNNWSTTVEGLIKDAVQCAEAGAAVVHVHLTRGYEIEIVKQIREQTDVIIQAGMSSDIIPDRTGDFEARPDLMSVILNHHDEHFTELSLNRLHPRDELEEYCDKLKDYKIKPEWEVWHTGSYYNLNFLINKKLTDPPYILTLFFNWPGGTWSPPTPDEYYHRVKYSPKNSVHTVSIMGKEQIKIATLAIINGGNVRVGTEDFPFLAQGIPAKNNAEIVSRMLKLAKNLGREIADPSEAREILGIK
ncbi:3-keto-5-aminohexanoate cleavage protein [Candidatus Hodarchaeum mangrovi]